MREKECEREIKNERKSTLFTAVKTQEGREGRREVGEQVRKGRLDGPLRPAEKGHMTASELIR